MISTEKETIKQASRKSESNVLVIDKNAFNLFCEISSIRGMHKITKAPTLFLKVLWIAFVFCMTSLLFLVTGLLIKDYLNYYTAWHVRTKFDDNSEFPAITLCSHNPFSLRANSLWKKPNAPNPEMFRERLKQVVIDEVNTTKDPNELTLMMFHDKIENYYMNIDYDFSLKISHGTEMLKYCAIFSDGLIIITYNCETEKDKVVEKIVFSHQKFFNCYTIQQTSNYSQQTITSLIILVSLTPAADIPELKNSFLMDILERGEGLKLVIHEPNSYPEIEEEGIDVQPGKMNNIKYEPVKWARHSTPPQKCKNGQSPIFDLKRQFNYSFSFCMNYNLQLKLIETCGCMNALFPRPFIPNEKIGYCMNLTHRNSSQIFTNLKCAQDFTMNVKTLKKQWENTKCMQKCNYFTYNTELSITKWVPSYEKLFRIADLINKTEIYLKNHRERESKEDYISYIQANITNSYINSSFLDLENENKFTYISLSRKTRNTVIKDEELVLDLAILMSRIGGLCSLFIGLTVSFFIELVEFGYLICRKYSFQKGSLGAKRINNNKRQISEFNNIIYEKSAANAFGKKSRQHCEEIIDFIKETESYDSLDHKPNVEWFRIGDPNNPNNDDPVPQVC